MTKEAFYRGKMVIAVEWWLHSCDLPDLVRWARLRVFDDGTADSNFGPCDTLYGFENRDYAGYILSEDEYIRFDRMDAEDEQEYGITLSAIRPPQWDDSLDQPFEYLGIY